MFYNRSLITTQQGYFFHLVNNVMNKCSSYQLVNHLKENNAEEVYTFMKTLPNGNVKGLEATRVYIKNPNGFSGYQIRFNFFRKEV